MFGDDLVKNRSAWPGNSAITGLALSSRRTSFHMPPAHTWPRVLERSSTDNLSEVGYCGNLELPSHPISEPLQPGRPVSAMWLFQPAKRRAFPIPAPGQVGGWGGKPAVFITFPPRKRLCV